MKAILDTSILLGPPPDPIDGDVAISSASLAELHVGVLVARSHAVRAERLRRLAVIENTFEALAILRVTLAVSPPRWLHVAGNQGPA